MRFHHGLPAPAARLAALALVLAPLAAAAGEGPIGNPDAADQGTHFFGNAKDVAGLQPLNGVNVTVAIAGTAQFLIVVTDEDGRFRLEGFGKTVNADRIKVTCNKPGYRMIEAMTRQVGGGKAPPIEVECLMAGAAKK